MLPVLPACPPGPVPPPPPPPFRATPGSGIAVVDASQQAALLAYGSSLEFETMVSAIDEQLLVRSSGGNTVVGPWLSLAPEKGAVSIPVDSLSKGRIIARGKLISGSDTVTTYWYVDSVGTGWRSIWVSDAATNNFIVSSLVIHSHGLPVPAKVSRTRIIVYPNPVPLAGTCGYCRDDETTWCRDTLFSVSMAPVIGSLPAWVFGAPRVAGVPGGGGPPPH